jgi:RNA recognition motif-containing protein
MKLHIGNLSKSMTDAELKGAIDGVSGSTSLEIIRDQAGASKGYGFAEFTTDEGAQAVIAALNGKELQGQVITVAVARPRKGEIKPRAQQV